MDYFKAKYTVVLKDLLNDETIKPKIEAALATYPLYEKKSKEQYIPSIVPTREQLNTKLLNYYKYREIGFETIGRFLDELEIAMHEIMPYYNQLFFSADQDYDILYNVDYEKEIISNKNAESTSNVNGSDRATSEGTSTSSTNDSTTTEASINNYNKTVKSSTPQDSLDISNTGIDTVNYADELGFSHDTNSDNGSSTGTSSSESANSQSSSSNSQSTATGTNEEEERIVEKTRGNYGAMSTQRQVQEYRDIIRNIEQELINDPRIQELFMLIY